MAMQIVLHFLIAIVWMFLGDDWTASGLISGFLVGLVLLAVMRRFWPNGLYLVKVWAIFKLIVLFMKELLVSSVAVIRQIVRPRLNIRPGIIAYTTELKSDWEVTLLSSLITLTPGTLTLEVSPDQGTLYIHAMDIEDAEELSRQIRTTFEKAIMEVTR